MLKNICFLVCIVVLASCSSTHLKSTTKQIEKKLDNTLFKNQFTGLLIYDIQAKDTIAAINSDKYFIPASTTKIFTFYTANTLLKEKIPTLKYIETKDSLFVEGTGDPSWLHPYFKDSTALQFMATTKKPIGLNVSNFKDEKYRPGWAWEDYQYYFSPELSPIPIYGNVVTITKSNSLEVIPSYFKASIKEEGSKWLRDFYRNEFYIPKKLKDTVQIPFITNDELSKNFIQQNLNKNIVLKKSGEDFQKKVLYGISTDSIYKRMLYNSDNFIAEQLMLVASSTLSNTLSFNTAKTYILENNLKGLKQKPRWVDGSGLSRYNLFTPESMVYVLQKLYTEVDNKRLFKLIPSWTSNKNIKSEPFIYAKSGSMGNTYNLCGYLKTKSGKVLLFSFMNNHFTNATKDVKMQIEEILKQVANKY